MTEMFSADERKAAEKTKKKLLTFWFIILGVYLCCFAALITVNLVDIAATASRRFYMPFMILSIVMSFAFICFSMVFFFIKYGLTRRFVKMLNNFERGIKETDEGTFIAFNDELQQKDGLEFYTAEFNTKPTKRGGSTLRKLLIERTREKPPFSEGESVKFVTHANILVSYEIISPKKSEVNL